MDYLSAGVRGVGSSATMAKRSEAELAAAADRWKTSMEKILLAWFVIMVVYAIANAVVAVAIVPASLWHWMMCIAVVNLSFFCNGIVCWPMWNLYTSCKLSEHSYWKPVAISLSFCSVLIFLDLAWNLLYYHTSFTGLLMVASDCDDVCPETSAKRAKQQAAFNGCISSIGIIFCWICSMSFTQTMPNMFVQLVLQFVFYIVLNVLEVSNYMVVLLISTSITVVLFAYHKFGGIVKNSKCIASTGSAADNNNFVLCSREHAEKQTTSFDCLGVVLMQQIIAFCNMIDTLFWCEFLHLSWRDNIALFMVVVVCQAVDLFVFNIMQDVVHSHKTVTDGHILAQLYVVRQIVDYMWQNLVVDSTTWVGGAIYNSSIETREYHKDTKTDVLITVNVNKQELAKVSTVSDSMLHTATLYLTVFFIVVECVHRFITLMMNQHHRPTDLQWVNATILSARKSIAGSLQLVFLMCMSALQLAYIQCDDLFALLCFAMTIYMVVSACTIWVVKRDVPKTNRNIAPVWKADTEKHTQDNMFDFICDCGKVFGSWLWSQFIAGLSIFGGGFGIFAFFYALSLVTGNFDTILRYILHCVFVMPRSVAVMSVVCFFIFEPVAEWYFLKLTNPKEGKYYSFVVPLPWECCDMMSLYARTLKAKPSITKVTGDDVTSGDDSSTPASTATANGALMHPAFGAASKCHQTVFLNLCKKNELVPSTLHGGETIDVYKCAGNTFDTILPVEWVPAQRLLCATICLTQCGFKEGSQTAQMLHDQYASKIAGDTIDNRITNESQTTLKNALLAMHHNKCFRDGKDLLGTKAQFRPFVDLNALPLSAVRFDALWNLLASDRSTVQQLMDLWVAPVRTGEPAPPKTPLMLHAEFCTRFPAFLLGTAEEAENVDADEGDADDGNE